MGGPRSKKHGYNHGGIQLTMVGWAVNCGKLEYQRQTNSEGRRKRVCDRGLEA